MRLSRRIVAVSIALALLAGCKGRKSPRQLIQEAIVAAKEGAEEKDISGIAELLSPQYKDTNDQDRAAVLGMVRLQFLRAQSIYLFMRIPAIHVQGPDRAEATVLVAMASTPIAAATQLAGLSANLYKFELQFATEGGKWRVLTASWSPAQPGDFL
jgi:hypothetical protein